LPIGEQADEGKEAGRRLLRVFPEWIEDVRFCLVE
jgi:hypothetical protein